MTTYYAHSGGHLDKSDWQTMSDHAFSTAKLAAEMARPFGLQQAAFVAGLFHDLGKYCIAFQKRLEGDNIAVDHSTAGAIELLNITKGRNKGMAELISYAILGHHTGLPDRSNETKTCYNQRILQSSQLDLVWRKDLKPEVSDLYPEMVKQFSGGLKEIAFSYAFMGRMIFSCLVDADFKDTEAFYAKIGQILPNREWPQLNELIDPFITRFEKYIASLPKKGELNQLRSDILNHVRQGANHSAGLFTLTVPTGGGKTLASLGFALDHAKQHGHRRIIYAIPFTSIIDQTSAIFRSVLGDEYVLEHHSAMDIGISGTKSTEQKDKLKLATEDWIAPVVVTTTIQLFESLFSARSSRARKLHHIADSIIILDEAQTLPRHLLLPIMRVLDELASHYGCTIILCTATQPMLGRRPGFENGLPIEGRELAPDPLHLAGKLARNQVKYGGVMDNTALVEALRVNSQILIVVNSRRHALELYNLAKEADIDGLVHLTTRHYAVHRRRILADIRNRLEIGQPCRLISTSLIEAGVDVDFPVGFRAEAGLDQIIQTAGRVNREGKRKKEDSLVTVFSSPDYPPPREIKDLIGDMGRIIGNHENIASPMAVEDYFREVYWRLADGLDEKKILDRFILSKSATDFAYRQVGTDFRMIENGMAPVIVAIEDKAKKAVESLRVKNIPSSKIARELQGYIVQIPPKDRDALIRNGQARFEEPELRGDQFAILQKNDFYQEDVGLIWENYDHLSVDDMLI